MKGVRRRALTLGYLRKARRAVHRSVERQKKLNHLIMMQDIYIRERVNERMFEMFQNQLIDPVEYLRALDK